MAVDQAQTRALAALQPFIHLAVTTKSPSPRILADLITRATSAQGTYIFAELLQTPAIQSLRSGDTPQEFQSYYTVLEIFSYGTLADYQKTPNLPPLTPLQQQKLTLLTLLSLASEPQPLTYDYLIPSLSLPSASALETVVIEAVYNGLVLGRLSPSSTPPSVHITSIAPLRDLRPSSLPEILRVLRVWESRCSSVVDDIEVQIAGIKKNAAKRKAREMARQQIVDDAVLSNELPGDGNTMGGVAGAVKTTRSAGVRSGSGDENRKGKGTGSKRDLDEQQEDEEVSKWRPHGSEEDGGVGIGLAKMEVEEGVGLGGKGGDGGRTAKRVLGKKGL